MEPQVSNKKTSKEFGWKPYIGFLFIWLTFGSFFTFIPLLMYNVKMRSGEIAFYSSLYLWLAGPITGYLTIVRELKSFQKIIGWHYWLWIVISLWVWLAPTIIHGQL